MPIIFDLAANGIVFFLTTSTRKTHRLMGCRLIERCCHLPCCLKGTDRLNHCVNHCEQMTERMHATMHSMRSRPSSDEHRCSEFGGTSPRRGTPQLRRVPNHPRPRTQRK